MNFDLTEDQLAYQDAARSFADKALEPYAAEWDANKVFPRDVIRRAGSWVFVVCIVHRKWADWA